MEDPGSGPPDERGATSPGDDDIGGDYEPTPQDRGPTTPPISARTELPFGLVFFLVLSLAVVVFAVQNTQNVQLQFLGWDGRFPLAVVIIAVVVISVILDEILGLVLRRRRRKRLAERRELERLRQMNS